MNDIEKYKSPEEAAITFREAELGDAILIENFLERPDIDSLFVPALSDPARNMTIKERVEGKIKTGKWIIAIQKDKVVGCMAIVPAKLTKEIKSPEKEGFISEGVSIQEWGKDEIWELSTVVVDQELSRREKVKGIGKLLFEMAKRWVRARGNKAGLVTDSWVGGDMGGFVMAMNTKEFQAQNKDESKKVPDTLIRIFSDPAKRGKDGPPSVVYGIPLDEKDWQFFDSKQAEIERLRKEYERLEK